LAGVLTPQEFAEANPDNDTALETHEWFDLVQQRFYAANPDNDGPLTVDELPPAGQRLLKLLQ
jgi:hypothetical protein